MQMYTCVRVKISVCVCVCVCVCACVLTVVHLKSPSGVSTKGCVREHCGKETGDEDNL
jgi:hypothetical protein